MENTDLRTDDYMGRREVLPEVRGLDNPRAIQFSKSILEEVRAKLFSVEKSPM